MSLMIPPPHSPSRRRCGARRLLSSVWCCLSWSRRLDSSLVAFVHAPHPQRVADSTRASLLPPSAALWSAWLLVPQLGGGWRLVGANRFWWSAHRLRLATAVRVRHKASSRYSPETLSGFGFGAAVPNGFCFWRPSGWLPGRGASRWVWLSWSAPLWRDHLAECHAFPVPLYGWRAAS